MQFDNLCPLTMAFAFDELLQIVKFDWEQWTKLVFQRANKSVIQHDIKE